MLLTVAVITANCCVMYLYCRQSFDDDANVTDVALLLAEKPDITGE